MGILHQKILTLDIVVAFQNVHGLLSCNIFVETDELNLMPESDKKIPVIIVMNLLMMIYSGYADLGE